jgi:hypothetical protein
MQPYINTGLATGNGTTPIFDFTLFHTDDPTSTAPRPIPGSVQIYSTDPAITNIVFSDLDGYGVLTSPLVSYDYLNSAGTIVATTSDVGTTIGSIIDNSPDTAWQSGVLPTIDSPIFIRIALPLPPAQPVQIPVAFRLRASNDLNMNDRAFPASISVWGSISNDPLNPPSITNTDQWYPIRGNVYPDEPGVEGESRWFALNNSTPYQYLRFQINDRWGNRLYVKLSEIELQILAVSSSINYDTAKVHLDYRGASAVPAAGTSFVAQFYGDDLSLDQQTVVQSFILDTNHFTTQFTYSAVRMVRADLSLQVYYNPAYSKNTILNNVSKSLQSLLQVSKGSISRSIKFSDLTGAVTSVQGVDYCVFINPPNGSNIDCDIDQYAYLTSLTVEMIITDRAFRI